MPFKLMVNIVDEDSPEDDFGNTPMIAQGYYDHVDYATATECNAAAGAALYKWLGANCSDWDPQNVHMTKKTFEDDDSRIVMYEHIGDATLRRPMLGALGTDIGSLVAQFYGRPIRTAKVSKRKRKRISMSTSTQQAKQTKVKKIERKNIDLTSKLNNLETENTQLKDKVADLEKQIKGIQGYLGM